MMLLLLAALNLAQAGELAGVKVPDQVTVGGQPLALNGMGLREKIVIDVYVGSLYLPQKTSQASKAVDADVPKRIQLNFIYETVTVEQGQAAERRRGGRPHDPPRHLDGAGSLGR